MYTHMYIYIYIYTYTHTYICALNYCMHTFPEENDGFTTMIPCVWGHGT